MLGVEQNGLRSASPIFIVGCPRSGTNLMRQMLDRHPSLAICGETHFNRLVYLRRKAFGDLSDLANRRRLISAYLESPQIERAGLDASADFAERLSREATSYRAMFTAILSFYADTKGKPRYGEKTPQHALFLGTLCEWFPDAVILHMVRDPRACVASLRRESWAPDSVLLNARTWLKLNQAARRFHNRPGYHQVRYEALVTDPVSELRKICYFLGEEYSPSMLAPQAVFTGDSGSPKRSLTAVTSERVELWRKELKGSELAQVEWALGPNLESFGYAREASQASASAVLRGVSYAAFDLARFVVDRLPAVWYRFGAQTKIAKFEYWSAPRTSRKHRGAGHPSRHR
jgi:hypothetical protein